MIFAHRVLYERGDQEIGREAIEKMFGEGGRLPGPESRWMFGKIAAHDLTRWKLPNCYGGYVGFRNRDDQFLFFMTYAGASAG